MLVRGKGDKDNSATVSVSNCLSSWVNGGRMRREHKVGVRECKGRGEVGVGYFAFNR